jgi:hypothetical protein
MCCNEIVVHSGRVAFGLSLAKHFPHATRTAPTETKDPAAPDAPRPNSENTYEPYQQLVEDGFAEMISDFNKTKKFK